MITSDEKLLFELIKVALGKAQYCVLPNAFDWNVLFELSKKQYVQAVVLDGLNISLTHTDGPYTTDEVNEKNQWCKYRWLGQVVQIERRNVIYERVIADLASFYDKEGFQMMLLKGYGLSKYWPNPSHRPAGDIDIYLLEKSIDSINIRKEHDVWKRADAILRDRLSIVADNSHHHHSVFTYEGMMVENHYDFLNVNSHLSNGWIEREFKSLSTSEHGSYKLRNGVEIIFPSPLLNALYVTRHNACHFAAERMNLRQLLDWALLMEKRSDDIDWLYFWGMCNKMGMVKFVLCMTAISVETFGFSKDVFHIPQSLTDFPENNRSLIERVMNDILHSVKYKNKNGLAYIGSRFKLWKANLWKHRIVYSDSIISTFFMQLISHLKKPSTILGK